MAVISEFSEPKHSKNNRGTVLGMTNKYIKFQVIGCNSSPETVRKRMACGGRLYLGRKQYQTRKRRRQTTTCVAPAGIYSMIFIPSHEMPQMNGSEI